MSIPERHEHMMESQYGKEWRVSEYRYYGEYGEVESMESISANTSTGTQKTKDKRPKKEADYTICDKMSVSGNKSIVEYLYDEGKCGDICRKGNLIYLFL